MVTNTPRYISEYALADELVFFSKCYEGLQEDNDINVKGEFIKKKREIKNQQDKHYMHTQVNKLTSLST